MAHYDDKLVYLRIPKCASSTLFTLLRNQHYCCKDRTADFHDWPARTDPEWVVHLANIGNLTGSEEVQRILQGRIGFTCVRHPFYWLASIWKFRAGAGWGTDQILDDCQDKTFTGFLRKYLAKHPGTASNLFRAFCGPENDSNLRYILRTEAVGSDLNEMFVDLKLHWNPPLHVPHNNQSKVRVAECSVELRTEVIAAEQEAVQRYGYHDWIDHQSGEEHKLCRVKGLLKC